MDRVLPHHRSSGGISCGTRNSEGLPGISSRCFNSLHASDQTINSVHVLCSPCIAAESSHASSGESEKQIYEARHTLSRDSLPIFSPSRRIASACSDGAQWFRTKGSGIKESLAPDRAQPCVTDKPPIFTVSGVFGVRSFFVLSFAALGGCLILVVRHQVS